MKNNSMFTWENQMNIIAQWRQQKESIVFTNGVFDILHVGHTTYLNQASQLGKKLVVGLNSDISVKLLNKGKLRPLQDEWCRASVLTALKSVSAVILFDESTPINLIEKINPNVLVKGGDYALPEIVGHDFVLKNGGSVLSVPLIKGYSTSAVEAKIINEYASEARPIK